jgi:hypothetical protein
VGLALAIALEMRGKYAEMLAMRVAHAEGREDPSRVRPRMSELASRFPGALREIDRLELAEIERRLARLDAFIDASGDEEPWMAAVAHFHWLARGALAAKRWLGGRRVVDAELVEAFTRATPSLRFPHEVRAWHGDLETIASPPRGRVMDAVFARLARELGLPERDARALVFGAA